MSENYPVKYGSKYDSKLSVVEIAKRVRSDIKEAVKVGKLPIAKYSVTTKKYSGGQSLSVCVSNLTGMIFTSGYLREGSRYCNGGYELTNDGTMVTKSAYLPWVNDALDLINEIVDSYNFDGSDSMRDYHFVNFYGRVCLDWMWAGKRLDETKKVLEIA